LREKDDDVQVHPSRLDLKTRICLIAAILHSTADHENTTVQKSIEIAIEIENAADSAVKQMKRENPIPRAKK
jgi:hypothetical protein